MCAEDIDARIRTSARRLREWRWMQTISTDLQDLLIQLRAEAKELIALGVKHPDRAKKLGKLLVAYHRLMIEVKDLEDKRQGTAN